MLKAVSNGERERERKKERKKERKREKEREKRERWIDLIRTLSKIKGPAPRIWVGWK